MNIDWDTQDEDIETTAEWRARRPRVAWSDYVATPDGHEGRVTEFDGKGNAKVYFTSLSFSEYQWYAMTELTTL